MSIQYSNERAPYSIGWTVDRRGYDDFYIVDKDHKPVSGGPMTLSSARKELQRVEEQGLPVIYPEEGRERKIPELWGK